MGAIFSGEQNTESKEEGARSLAPANRKGLHPKGGLVNTEKFRGRTPPSLISTWPERLIPVLKDKLKHITHFKSLSERVSTGIGHHQTRSGQESSTNSIWGEAFTEKMQK